MGNDMIWTPYDTPAKYSKNSLARLATCEKPIQDTFKALAKDGWDISIICGVRTKEEQNKAFDSGLSKARWPDSDHNIVEEGELSQAVDAAPFIPGIGIPWTAGDAVWVYFAGVVLSKAQELGYELEWGGFYSGLKDMNHFSLKR